MPTEMTDIVAIATKVNKMSPGMMRLRLKALEMEYEDGTLTFTENCELQFLLVKILISQINQT